MAKREGRTGDPETDSILDEMESDGVELPEFKEEGAAAEGDDAESTEPEKPAAKPEEEKPSEESDKPGEESEVEGSEEDDDEDDADESEESGDDEDDDEEGEEEGTEPTGKNNGRLTLVQKYRKARKDLKEIRETLSKVEGAQSQEKLDAEIKAYADKTGMDFETAKGLIELAAKAAGLPQETLDDLAASRKERRDREYWDDQRKKFRKDFEGNVTPVLENMGLTKVQIQETYDLLDTKEGSKFWAWDKKNKEKTLVQLALGAYREREGTDGAEKKPRTRVSSEGGGSRRTTADVTKAPSEMSGEEIDSMSDEEFDKYSDGLGKAAKSNIHRS